MKISASFTGMKILVSLQVRLHLICRAKGFRGKTRHLKTLRVRSPCRSEGRSAALGHGPAGRTGRARRAGHRHGQRWRTRLQQHRVPAGTFLGAAAASESVQQQNRSRAGPFLLLLIYRSIFYRKSPELPSSLSLGTATTRSVT